MRRRDGAPRSSLAGRTGGARGAGGLRRASGSLRPILDRLRDPREALEVAWAASVGSSLAGRSLLGGVDRGCLVVEVADTSWQRAIEGMSRTILAGLREKLGPRAPHTLEAIVTSRAQELRPRPRTSERPAEPSAEMQDDPVLETIEASVTDPDLRKALKRAYRAHARRYGTG